jgi:hypothetical protein
MVMIPNSARMGDMPKGEPLPEGVYQLRLEKAVYKTSKEKGTPMAEVTFVVQGPVEAEEHHGRKVFDNLMLAGEGMFRTRQLLEAAGWGEDDTLEDTEQLVGLEVGAAITVEKPREQDGKSYPARSKVARYISLE